MSPTDDNKSLANVIHELVGGTKINTLPGGKPLYHFKVKNTKSFKYIQQLIAKSENWSFEEIKGKEKVKKKADKNNCPGTHSKFMQFKADADLFTNGTILSTKPFSVKYGPFS